MRDPLRVAVLGTGQMGSGVVRLVLEKRGLELVGAHGRRRERVGLDVGRAVGLSRDLGIALEGDLQRLLERARPDVAIQTTCSRAADARDEIETLVRGGANVISIAEEMAYPSQQSPRLADHLRDLALEHGVSILGTGVNPGFVLDLLVIVLSGVCARIESVEATRVNDLSPYGPSVLASQGVGLSPDAFERGVADGEVVGHFGFPESMGMIARALGWEIERIEQSREPIVARVRRETPLVTVEPGQTAGCLHRAVAIVAGRPAIQLLHPQQVQPEREGLETGDTISIRGTPPLRIEGRPEIPGGTATVALAVNAVPRVLDAAPGLWSMADLPPPAAILGDARALLRFDGSPG